MDAAYNKGVAVLACEMGLGLYCKDAIKYWTCLPYMRNAWHQLLAMEDASEEERYAYCLEKKQTAVASVI
jgi:hypothetical protein